MQNDIYCNNCGKTGHLYHQCKLPITSIGIVAFRMKDNIPEFLMIRRKDSLGYIDFMRGKYTLQNKEYLINMLNQMTIDEKENLKKLSFDELWKELWGGNNVCIQYKNEESISKEKFNSLKEGINISDKICTLEQLIEESNQNKKWYETEWGFPKGRRNNKESDYDCALREFNEETGYNTYFLHNLQNIIPYEEIFTGSNYKSYKHKYFIMYMNYENTLNDTNFEKSEVSKMEWKNFENCLLSIRSYNIEKKRILSNIYKCINENKII
tara:strand:- start:2865 stop:3668 length:804 start_codon:yes stop_codon:yes gene_type:complete